ncbi:MAG TPA: alpha/beta hydrolase [Gaiellaceae bacterium]|nr:alpha/beta hydrolase [Gaiellaceae bacterium]
MNTPKNPIFTPGRIIALALITLAILGLAWLRFGFGDEAVSVPAGAQAGDLILEDCEYATEDGAYPAECGTLVVPENRADPGSRLIALPVIRIHARNDASAVPVFRLEGGPGGTNMEFAKASRLADDRDVVLVGYRGVDGSVKLDCPEVESALKRSQDLVGEASLRAYGEAFRACADRLAGDGVDPARYGVVQQVDDLEAARVALGYDRIDLLSESAGTRTALVYSWRYPESIRRSVMIGANPPGHFLWDGETTDEQIGRYAKLCAQDESCGGRTDDLAASLTETAADIPERWWFLPVEEGNVRLATFFGLMESTPENAPLSAPLAIDAWLAAEEGDAGGLWFQSLLAELAFPESVVWGQYAAFGSADAEAARDYFAAGPRDSILGDPGTDLVWGGGRLVDAWPAAAGAAQYDAVRTSETETLVISGALDVTTPPQQATEELLPHLPNGDQVVLEGFGHSVDFWTYQPEAGTRLLDSYLAGGEVDDSLYEPQAVDFTPTLGLGEIATIALGSMLALAALTVLALLWLPARVHLLGRYGRKSGAALRSLWAAVFGVGGWLAGVLLVLAAMPGVPLDDEALGVLSVGVPVALAVYWGSVDPARPGKAALFAAAAAGALAGAALGLHATTGMVALLTAVVGAVAGANLAVIVLGTTRDRAARGPRVTDSVAEPPAPGREPVGAGTR